MFHAVTAILLQNRITVKTHTGLIAKFGEIFIQPGTIDREYGRMLARAEELREKADYSFLSPITREQAEMVVKNARSFLEEIKKTYISLKPAIIKHNKYLAIQPDASCCIMGQTRYLD